MSPSLGTITDRLRSGAASGTVRSIWPSSPPTVTFMLRIERNSNV
ncbi:MAG: hypothetical protein ACXW6V_07505 [Candidatus Binatia bacterium]